MVDDNLVEEPAQAEDRPQEHKAADVGWSKGEISGAKVDCGPGAEEGEEGDCLQAVDHVEIVKSD